MQCPINYNPADYYVHRLAVVPGQELESRISIDNICQGFEQSVQGKILLQAAARNGAKATFDCQIDDNPYVQQTPYKTSWPVQFKAVLGRSSSSVTRDVKLLRVKAFQSIVRVIAH